MSSSSLVSCTLAVLLTAFLAAPAAAIPYEYPAPFHLGDCEAYIGTDDGEAHVARARDWIARLSPHYGQVTKLDLARSTRPVDLEAINPNIVWYPPDPDRMTMEDVEARYQAALARSRESRGVSGSEPVHLDPPSNVSVSHDEKMALNIHTQTDLHFNGLRADMSAAPEGNALMVRVYNDSGTLGEMRLSTPRLQLGFNNQVAQWHAARRPNYVAPPPEGFSGHEMEAELEHFFRDHGVFGFFRRLATRTFVYVFRMEDIARPPETRAPFELEIYTADACAREDLMQSRVIFRPRKDGSIQCLKATGLRLSAHMNLGVASSSGTSFFSGLPAQY